MDHVAHQTTAGAHTVAKAGNVADQTAHQTINKVATHKPHIAEHKITHAQPVDQTIAQADIGQIRGTDSIAPATDATAGSYTIKAGDNLWNIAREHLGSGLRWTEIYKMNTDVLGSNPSLIHTGTTIRLPGAGTEIATAGAEAGKYVVQPGDNLWDIASEHLGGGQHWGELYKANTDVIGSNPRLILPGQELSLSGQPGMQLASHGPTVHPTVHPTVQPTVAQHAPVQPTAPAPTHAAQPTAVAEVAQPKAVAETSMPTATYDQMPAPAAHPVVPATHAEQSVLPPAEAAQAPVVRPTPAIKPSGSSIVSSSLRPDLSFLNKKPR
jgi:LysM repeat protein